MLTNDGLRSLACKALGYEPTETEIEAFGNLTSADLNELVELEQRLASACETSGEAHERIATAMAGMSRSATTGQAVLAGRVQRKEVSAAQRADQRVAEAEAAVGEWCSKRGLRPIRAAG